MSRNSCHFRGCANQRADWCKRVDWSEPWPRSATLDSVGKMLVLAAGGWKLFSSSQEGVFGGKTFDLMEPTYLQSPEKHCDCVTCYRPSSCLHVCKIGSCLCGVTCIFHCCPQSAATYFCGNYNSGLFRRPLLVKPQSR